MKNAQHYHYMVHVRPAQSCSSLRSLCLDEGSWRGVAIEEGDWKLLGSHGQDLQDLQLGCLVPGSLPGEAVTVLEGLHGLKKLALRCGEFALY